MAGKKHLIRGVDGGRIRFGNFNAQFGKHGKAGLTGSQTGHRRGIQIENKVADDLQPSESALGNQKRLQALAACVGGGNVGGEIIACHQQIIHEFSSKTRRREAAPQRSRGGLQSTAS